MYLCDSAVVTACGCCVRVSGCGCVLLSECARLCRCVRARARACVRFIYPYQARHYTHTHTRARALAQMIFVWTLCWPHYGIHQRRLNINSRNRRWLLYANKRICIALQICAPSVGLFVTSSRLYSLPPTSSWLQSTGLSATDSDHRISETSYRVLEMGYPLLAIGDGHGYRLDPTG